MYHQASAANLRTRGVELRGISGGLSATSNDEISDEEDALKPFLGYGGDSSSSKAFGLFSRRARKAFYGVTESHQYEQDESEVWKHHQLQRHFEDKGHW